MVLYTVNYKADFIEIILKRRLIFDPPTLSMAGVICYSDLEFMRWSVGRFCRVCTAPYRIEPVERYPGPRRLPSTKE